MTCERCGKRDVDELSWDMPGANGELRSPRLCPACAAAPPPPVATVPAREMAAAMVREAMLKLSRASDVLALDAAYSGVLPPEYYEINRLWRNADDVTRKLERK